MGRELPKTQHKMRGHFTVRRVVTAPLHKLSQEALLLGLAWPGRIRSNTPSPVTLQVLTELKSDNQRLKDENGALIRVISKLSK